MPDTIFPLNLEPDLLKSGADGNYEAFSSQTVYIRYEGTLQIPLSEGEGGSTGEDDCIVVRTSRAFGRKVIVWTAVKIGEVPKVPSMEPADPTNEILDGAATGISEPKIIPSGNSFQVVLSGKYTYHLLKAPNETTGYTSVKNPYVSAETRAQAQGDRFMSQT